ncbi:MAG: ABC transporter permease [Casimicrobiaceae bacterium]|jgi:putative spermidine/putrescine transport system permease protein
MLRGAAAAAHADAAAPDDSDDIGLRRALRRSQRREQWRAAILVLPLFVFIAACFVVPIGAMLARGVIDTDIARILPGVTQALRSWDGRDLPAEAAFAALVADIHAAREAGTLASAATRLNYDVPGFRTLLFGTGRVLPKELSGPARDVLIGIDPKWGERETWVAIRRAGGPTTDFYLLGALDLRRDADNEVIGAPSEQRVFRAVLGRTLWIAGVVTLVCLVLGYPVALVIARQPPQRAAILIFLVLLPFWTSLLVRTVAWVVLLQKEGVLNSMLLSLSIVNEPLKMIYNRFAVYVAMIHVLLPFMVLPLYSVMRSISPTYLRAASSLGATPWTAFRRVYMPQTLPGIAAGCLMVFIQALGYYITPALVGGADDQMISYFIAFYASKTVNWGMAAALSIMLLASTLVLYAVYNRLIGVDRMRLA